MIAESKLEIAQLYCDRGEYKKALEAVEPAQDLFYAAKNYRGYLDVLNLKLRIHAEMEDHQAIFAIKDKLQDLVLKEGFELNSRTYYTLAICADYKDQTDVALEYLQKSLALGLAVDHKEDICRAIFGLAKMYSHPKIQRYEDALKEIYNLEVFFQVYDFPEIRFSTRMVNSQILMQLHKYEEALEVTWKAYEEVKNIKRITLVASVLYRISELYYLMNERDLAISYAKLAQKSVHPKNQVEMARSIQELVSKIGFESDPNYDLVFDNENHMIVEKKLGKIDFKNQFILLDLLKLFLQNPGTVFSKEYLVENVWKQPYDPAVHDNKIYVTIKRLRRLIEPDFDKPKYIFRAKNGYYVNKSVKVFMDMDQGNQRGMEL
ncbi:MAG: winged helix-turn-helix domain-containing protein [Pseudobdellovibrionaceae bacterium]